MPTESLVIHVHEFDVYEECQIENYMPLREEQLKSIALANKVKNI